MPAKARGATTAPKITEKAFQQAVVNMATQFGWRHFHPFDMRRSDAGWPDLILVRGGRLVVAELKSMAGKLTPAQESWLGTLGAVPCCEVYVWFPTDAYWQEIERVLR